MNQTASEGIGEERRFVGRRGLAALYRVSLDAVDRYVYDPDDPVPHHRFGRKILFDLDEVARWSRRQAQHATKRRRSRT